MGRKKNKYEKMAIKHHYERKIDSLSSRITWLEHELDYKQEIIDINKKTLNKDFELAMAQREKIVALCLALENITGIPQDEELLEKYNQKVKYVSDFCAWIDSEPPVRNLFAWLKWKKNKPERENYND